MNPRRRLHARHRRSTARIVRMVGEKHPAARSLAFLQVLEAWKRYLGPFSSIRENVVAALCHATIILAHRRGDPPMGNRFYPPEPPHGSL